MIRKLAKLAGLALVVAVGVLILLVMLAEVGALLGLGYIGLRDKDWGLLIFVAVLCGAGYAAIMGGWSREGGLEKRNGTDK